MGDWLDRVVSTLLSFMAAFFALMGAWIVSETLGYFHPQPWAVRKALFFVILGVSVAFAVWRWWRMARPVGAKATAPADARAGPGTEAEARLSERMRAVTAQARPAAASTSARSPAVAAAIARAARQAIVFRQLFPPPLDAAPLSFWGGAPVMPPDARWPRSDDGAALSFVLQVNCADIPADGRLGLMPDSGVLFFFLDLEWGDRLYHVAYAEHPDETWRPLAPPPDLKPLYGASEARYAAPWAGSDADLPRLLPKWPFRPVVIDVVPEEPDDDGGVAPPIWPGERALAAALLAAEGGDDPPPPFDIKDFIADDGTLARPFAAYPQDWRAARILAASIQARVARARRYDKWLYRDLPEAEREAVLDAIAAAAAEWAGRADHNAPFDAVPQEERDRLWAWAAQHRDLVRFVLADAVTLSIEFSLTASAEAAARVPPTVAGRVRERHALALKTDRGIFAATPDRMLAAPSDVQGNQLETAATHLLLLEMSSNDGLQHRFGEGVYQFWIAPSDLERRRFDRVLLTTDAY